jgi:hypothetical protein
MACAQYLFILRDSLQFTGNPHDRYKKTVDMPRKFLNLGLGDIPLNK